MKSVAASDGSLQVVATFRPEIDPDTAAVRVQNRVSQVPRAGCPRRCDSSA